MKDRFEQKIDFSRKRFARLADKFYNEGDYLSALRFAQREREEYGEDVDVLARFADIYEGMGLQGSALHYWFRFLDVAHQEDLPDVYEGIAVNFLGLGNESASAHYYGRLIDADKTLPVEMKMDIAETFAMDKKKAFRFTYPPEIADYSKELHLGSKALKAGDCQRAIDEFSKVEKGNKDYLSAKEMEAVARLLTGEAFVAEEICKELLSDYPDDVRIQATLAAAYLEQGRKEESIAIANDLAKRTLTDVDELYKAATVCCENGLHAEAYRLLVQLDNKSRYDGRTLYFKAVAAGNSGNYQEAAKTLEELCTIYPDAEVAKYYLEKIREYLNSDEVDKQPPELIYFYHLPQEEREERCRALIKINASPQDDARLFGLLALHDGYFHWCFDEMDGSDHDLQYLGLMAAVKCRADDFVRDVLLDFEIADVLKVETLRMLLERNEDMDVGVVLCNVYREVYLNRIIVGRKRRKKFIQSYAKVASKFIVINPGYADKLQGTAETLYEALEKANALDLVDNTDDCACAIFLLAGLTELGRNAQAIAAAFDANLDKVHVLMSYLLYEQDAEGTTSEID